MNHYSHDDLHKLIGTVPELQKKSDEIHALPKAKTWYEWEKQKIQMAYVCNQATNCRCFDDVVESIIEAVDYLKCHSKSPEDLGSIPFFQECLSVVRAMMRVRAKKHQCNSPNGNDLVCYCHKKADCI